MPRFGVASLVDTNPPLMADAGGIFNTDPSMCDLFGRSQKLSRSRSLTL